MSAHDVTIEFDGSFHIEHLNCHEPLESLCHAVWRCECEELFNAQIRNGMPAHQPDPFDDDTWHAGTFDDTQCSLKEWFENDDDGLRGTVTLPVKATWEGDFYIFEVVTP